MDSSKLIKQINTLHTVVKATRIQIIRKLIRDSKDWSAKATKNNANRRATRKAEATEAILKHIKSIPPSELVEQVLRYQPLMNGASLETATVAHRSMARFVQDAKLNRFLKSLESQLGEGAHSMLLEVLQKKKTIKSSVAKKQRKERIKKVLEKKKDKQQKKQQRTQPLKDKAKKVQKLETDEKDSLYGTDDEESPTTLVCDSYESDDDSEEFDLEQDESEDLDSEEELNQQSKRSISVSEDDNYSSDEEPLEDRVEEPKVKSRSLEKRNDPCRLSNPDVKKPERPIIQSVKQPIKKKEVNYIAPEEEDDNDGCELITDSFFVTDSGERYVAVAPKLKPNVDDDVQGDDNMESWTTLNRKKRREQQWVEEDNTEAFETDVREVKQRKVRMYHTSISSVNKQDLHPSWAAKQAQKGIKPFAGKKVVFDNDNESGMGSSFTQRSTFSSNLKTTNVLHPSWAAKQAQKGIKPFAGKKVVFDVEGDVGSSSTYTQHSTTKFNGKTDDLHPSWAAKQAQKGFKPFAGKKMIFDDESGNDVGKTISKKPSVTNNSTNDVHPSWAAKQAQSGIKSFTGKKTVFDDDNDGYGNGKTNGTVKVMPKNNSTDDRHPSWVAKQAQNGIKPFAGKKKTFNADDSSKWDKPVTPKQSKTPTVKSTDLHPSWVAKQAQSGIKQFAGTKISFDD